MKYIDYKDYIYILEVNPSSKKGFKIQWGGVGCFNTQVMGKVFKRIQSENKYFNRDFWYRKVSPWPENYPKTVCVKWDEKPPEIEKTLDELFSIDNSDEEFEKRHKKIRDWAETVSIPTENILNEIISEVNQITGLNFEYGGVSKEYQFEWGEAYIPLKLNGKMYILTWENCD